MEHCMELRALKSRVRGELTMQKTQQHIVFDDFLVMNVINGGAVPNEDFSVDCFLDFNNGEFEEDSVEQKDFVPGSYQEREADNDSNSNSSSFTLDSVFTSELSVPDNEIAGLEWVSHFVDDSLPELPIPCMVFRQQNGGVSLPFDRAASLRYPNSSSGSKKAGQLPWSSSSRARSLTDPLLQPHQLVNQVSNY